MYASHLECPKCGNTYESEKLIQLCDCGAPLLVRYDINKIRDVFNKDAISSRKPDLWRYRELFLILAWRDSTRLETDTLIWSRKSDLITGGGRVLIRRPDGEETGVGFEATSDLKRWSMREVTTRLTRPDTLP